MLVATSVPPPTPSLADIQDSGKVERSLRTWSTSSYKWEISPHLTYPSLLAASILLSSSSCSSRLPATPGWVMKWRRSYLRRPTPWWPPQAWWAITVYSACQGIQNHIQFSGAGGSGTLTAADIMKALKDNLDEADIPAQYQFGETSVPLLQLYCPF